MSLALHELLLCCRQIETDKATERKKEIVKFRRLLRDPETVQQLDQNSDRRQGKQLNWDTVFRFLQKYVYKETESIKSAKASVSQATQSNRRKKMQDISCVVKDFIRCANKRAPRLKCTELLLHVANTVKDPTSCSAYGTDYSSILLKDILSVRKYWCEITFQQWEDLLTLYFSLYLKPESTVNRLLVARIIHTLTRGCCQQTDGLHSMFFQFFSKTMKRVGEEKNPPGLDQILAALNVFLTSASVNCRMRVSKLGEDLFSTVLRIWTMQRPKDALKEEIVEFFRLLLRIHHPKGAKTVDEGAYAFDPDRWKRNLYSLYDTLVNEISQIGSRGKYSSGSRNIAAKENLVELMADICHQLFTEDTQVLDITQASFLVTQREPSGAASKRRRIELGWEVLRDNLQKSHNDFDIIPWLQIATCLIARYPASLPSSELTPLLTVLHQLLAQQRRSERATYVLHCLKEVAVCLKQKTDVKITPKSDLHKLWPKVWAVTLRSISSPHTEEESFALLASILQGALIPGDTDFWKIFSGAAAKPSNPGVHCLALALTSYCLPEHISAGFDNPMHEANGSQSSLKEEIIKWLLFGHSDDEVEDTNELSPVITKDFSNPALQKILVSLTMKDSRAAMKFFRSLSECSCHNKREDEASFADAEELYLHTSFSEIPGVPPVGPMEADKDGSSPCLTVNLAIREKLERDLLTLSEQQLNSYSSEAIPPVNLVQCACLLTGVLGCYLYADIITEEDALQSHLFQKAKMLMQCAGESTSFLKSKLNEDAKISSLAALITQCVGCICNCTKDTPIRFLTDLFLHLFTPRMLNDLTDIGKLLLTSTGSSVETSELDLIGDDAESRMETEDQGVMDLFDDHCVAEPAENIEYGELQHVTGALSPLSEEHLTKQEAVLLQTLEFLCLCTTAAQNHTVNFRPSDTRRKLLALIDNNSLDISKPLHLHVYLLLLNELPKADAPLPVDEIITLLRPLIEVCSSYRRDQDVCAAILKKLLPVVNCLGQDPMDTEETYDAQGQLLNVIQAFWILAKDGKYTAVVRASLVNCMKALLKVDPQSKWAILTVDDQDVPVRDAFPAFLADSHHQVRFHTAVSISRLFQDVKAQALPLQLQQKAFDNIYLKVQEGMRYLPRSSSDPDEVPDETWNRRATLLMLISAILRCSPVCEKQALFAICQSVKENGLDPQLIRKELGRVSTALGYRGVKDFMASHLDYLILEWLRMKVPGYSLSTFPYILLNYSSLNEFYRACYKVLVPHLVIRNEFEEVKSLAQCIEEDWKLLLADCFPRILVNILPYFASECADDKEMLQKREVATKVYDLLQDESCLGKQQIDNLFFRNLPEIVVELLMTLHETSSSHATEDPDLLQFAGELDPAPNPPYFPSSVIKATLHYISSCHKSKMKSLVTILSKTPDSFQKILLAICNEAAETNNVYKKHRILTIYHLFVNLLLAEIKDGLGNAWAFVLRDVIYTIIHHINSRPAHGNMDDVSTRSLLLCLDLLHRVCRAAVTHCEDALECHLHVIVGSLIPLANSQESIQEKVCDLLNFLVIENKDNENLYHTIKLLDPFPDIPLFKNLRQAHQKIKYSKGPFSLLKEIQNFLSVSACDSLPLTRLEGLNDLRKQLEQHKDQIKELVRDCQGTPQDSVIASLVVNLLQLSKNAVHQSNGKEVLEAVGSCLGELGPIDFSTIALQHKKDSVYLKADKVFEEKELQCVLVMLTLINNALTDHRIQVRSAAATCLKNILATKTGAMFWEACKDKGEPMLLYLQPFRAPKKKFLEVEEIQREGALESLDDPGIWIPQNENHESWIKHLTCTLLESGGVKSEVLLLLKPMCEVKADFCQAVVPYIVHNILLNDSNQTWRTLLSKNVQRFFTSCCRSLPSSSRSATPASSDSESEGVTRGAVDIASRRTMLTMVEHLRKQRRPVSGTAFDDNFWLDLNYLEVAMAVQSCAAHFTALLYSEIYTDKVKQDGEQRTSANRSNARKCLKFEEGSQTLDITGLSEKSKEETGISLQDLLMDIYRSIGEPDSLYGCGGGKMLHPLARIRTYEHEAKWGKALVTFDLEMNFPPVTRQAGIMQALQNFGLCHMLSTYLRGLEHENAEWSSELQEIHFQAAWRNMQWDDSLPTKNETSGPGYHEFLYRAVQSLRDKEFCGFHDHIKYARVKEVEELCSGSLESVYSLYPALCRLQAIGELASVGQMFSRSITDDGLKDTFLKWQRQSQLLKDSDFEFLEPVLSLRSVILETLLQEEKKQPSQESLKDILTKHLLDLSRIARSAGNTQLPEKAMFQIKQYNPSQLGVSEWQLEEAQIFWDKEEPSLAREILKQMINKLEIKSFEVENDSRLRLLYAESLRLCGKWLAETCLESPTVIMQNYLEKAVEFAGYSDGAGEKLQEGRMKAFLSLARFSDAQYQRIDNYMKSSEFENKQALLRKAKEEVGLIKHHKVQNNRYTVKVERELQLDECAILALIEDRKRFLCKAVDNYISCLVSGEEHDMWIFRLCSLWLENSAVSDVNSMMRQDAQKIPSHKFLPLMYQLAARMGTKKMGNPGFHDVLNNLIGRISMDHPHHTLFIILALANANKDDQLIKAEAVKRSRLTKNAPKQISQLDKERMEAARHIVDTIKKRRTDMVRDVERLCDAYITLANMDANQWKSQRNAIPIPSDQPITKLNKLHDVVIPTMEIKVDPSGKYENLVTIVSFKPEFRLAGGLNLPKIIDCVGSDGKERRQLVKGQDDLRQDAVMQQVFQMCNTLLRRNSETRKRKLTIRRYKVVPLSQRSGVLEWCTGTVPIGEYLVNDKEGAHKRYRPGDYGSLQCQRKMMEVQRGRFEEKYQMFLNVCENFRPVFRYFCMEKFLDPAMWFEKRLAYTRSVATSSIVGYIVGLGDRHVQNILIDEESAELVHIDLGVAFEQGKILPTPETVPFRLTRDIVDGMGITGVEGVFRRCCEKTMEVMRNNQEALLTIVEVLLYDPLFDWTMNPLKALYLQQDEVDLNATLGGDDPECNRNSCDSQSVNKVAERVLLRLQEKLKGVEEGMVLSVGGQVNHLIQQAMDPKNLSSLFPGWKAWV
ncbi:ATM serine/threonine kinase L homeolog [Xenopus laevis]|uniref:non-specific serine/threonine protein kinase n=1 Tax=Xenopus laevis TaxID=8355 RepID=Q5MPF8_XENLA|nr:ATM serine/threonine kinase L homeolog [Xenopus laevis]AAT72929.1 ataxia telangiectasia mutated [Xenopus laevis]